MEPDAVVALITALVLFGAALVGLFVKVQQVHVLVNSKMTDALNRISQLTEALVQSDVDVPDKPNGHL